MPEPVGKVEQSKAVARYETFLRREVSEVVSRLPSEFTGDMPLCLSLFQSTADGGRLVFIDRDTDLTKSLIWLRPGMSTHSSFLDPDPTIPWEPVDVVVTKQILKYYRDNNPPSMREALGACYVKRFKHFVDIDELEGHVPEGTGCQLSYVCPTPYMGGHHPRNRVPRLGTLYTFNESFGTKSRVHISATKAADCILEVRLRVFLENHHPLNRRSPLAIAHDFATRIFPNEEEIQYLVARLLLAHHCFYPQDQIAAILIRRHAKNSDLVWTRHGWPPLPVPSEKVKYSDNELFRRLSDDLAFLISSCERIKIRTKKETKEGNLADPDELISRIAKVLPTVFAVLCGATGQISLSGKRVIEPTANIDERLVMVRPPASMIFSSRTPLPAFKEKAIHGLTRDTVKSAAIARSYLEDLCGIQSESKDANVTMRSLYSFACSLIDVFRGEEWGEKISKDWLVNYVRARCSLTAIKARSKQDNSKTKQN